jgi:hypothetical protein
VSPDLSVKVFTATDLGTGVGKFSALLQAWCSLCRVLLQIMVANCAWTDFNAVEAVVEATHRYKEIFYGDE